MGTRIPPFDETNASSTRGLSTVTKELTIDTTLKPNQETDQPNLSYQSSPLSACSFDQTHLYNEMHSQCRSGPNCVCSNQNDYFNRHSCLRLTEPEFEDFVGRSLVVQCFASEWGFNPVYMPQICGVNMHTYFCENESGSGSTSPGSNHCLNQFLIPAGMPYTTHTSAVFGVVYTTPFYSVIPSNVPQVPAVIFSLSKLTLDRVINNKVFRHELAFNADLLIELPATLTEVASSSKIWKSLQYELYCLLHTKLARPPCVVIAQVLRGIRSLMLSILPSKLASHVNFYYDPLRLLRNCPEYDPGFLDNLISFTETVLDATVIPMRKVWVKKMRTYFAEGKANRDSIKLTAGLKTAISLLNVTKVDYVNAQIRDRVSLLRHNSGKVELENYRQHISSGKISRDTFLEWLKLQPRIESLWNKTPSASSSQPEAAYCVPSSSMPKDLIINYLTSGFLKSFISNPSHDSNTEIFFMDKTRIKSLQRRFQKFIISNLESKASKLLSTVGGLPELKKFIRSPKLSSTKAYQLVEQRVLGLLAVKVYTQLVLILLNRQCTLDCRELGPSEQLVDYGQSLEFQELEKEITNILLLHWMGASSFYEEASWYSDSL